MSSTWNFLTSAASAAFQSQFLLDILKTAIGAFFGAGFAFVANEIVRRKQRGRDERAAGNLALSVVSRLYGDFVLAKLNVLKDFSDRQLLPTWMQLRPTYLDLSSSISFDVESLSFLFQSGKADLFERLANVEVRYHALRRMLEHHSIISSRMVTGLADHGFSNHTLADVPRIENVIPASTKFEMLNLVEAIARRRCWRSTRL